MRGRAPRAVTADRGLALAAALLCACAALRLLCAAVDR
jgi:hypothetical protein